MLIPTQKQGKHRNGHSLQTHCFRGHEFNEENTYISPKSQKRSCRICDKLKDKERFDANPDAVRAKNREHMREWRAANKEQNNRNWTELRRKKKLWLDSLKTACIICGESDIACLEFHHRNPESKITEVSLAVARWSIKRIQVEIDKCDLLCSNCHRKLHAAEKAVV